ncbi:MAG TPA: N-acetyl sugar amidotransferase [Paludibacteraceae bacterium]|nr:N-acetyl sugar amidotransferase [Paludibacteraceae bacterium]
MPFTGQICSVGVFDESIPDIKFDTTGKSNYAYLFDALVEAYPRGEKGQQQWEMFLQDIRKAGKGKRYDCIIGISGGTDSCYLLHLAAQWGLRVLAVNLDNGFNSEIAVKNIRCMTEQLNIDLETYVIDYAEVKDLIRCYMRASLPWIDTPTDLAIKSVLYKIADREKISYILRGNDFRSEGSQPKDWTYGDGKQLIALHHLYGKVKLKTFPNYTIGNMLYYTVIKRIKTLYPYYYIEYNKNKAQKFLSEQYGWEYYGGHDFENIFTRFCMSYWLYEKFGIDKRKITLSAQVMSGEINREEALSEINNLPYEPTEKEEMINYVCKKLDISNDEFLDWFHQPNKNFKDYPSYNRLFTKYYSLYSWFINKIFLHKPQSLFKDEIIGK